VYAGAWTGAVEIVGAKEFRKSVEKENEPSLWRLELLSIRGEVNN
tara:strand:+ start:446 stop:580 length:135 start_codon:yes stop_codon:yes gene_type:complete